MPGLAQGVPAQVFTPRQQRVITLTAATPHTLSVPPSCIVRYTSESPVGVTLGATFDANANFTATDNLFGIHRHEAITLQCDYDAVVYLEIG